MKALMIFCLLVLNFSLLADQASAEQQQVWTVQIVNDTATIRATKKTGTKYIQATIKALKTGSVEKFALKAVEADDLAKIQNVDIQITILEQDAELLISPDLKHEYVVGLIKHLSEAGIEELKMTLSGK